MSSSSASIRRLMCDMTLASCSVGRSAHGPIPARAGEPNVDLIVTIPPRAYPRPRGGAPSIRDGAPSIPGLSPPARGSPPSGSCPAPSYLAAYPRPRGGAPSRIGGDRRLKRQRPNVGPIPARAGEPIVLSGSCPASLARRPIPARAGEPRSKMRVLDRPASTAYPRPRGGASHSTSLPCAPGGLSPPARGSHVEDAPSSAKLRPIPARAGEPIGKATEDRDLARRPIPARAGEPASPRRSGSRCPVGLSPPARGEPSSGRSSRCAAGRPIPARAGEPPPHGHVRISVKLRPIPARAGEPQSRRRCHAASDERPIPARAGEPTSPATSWGTPVRGLSPPARGSHPSL